MNNPLKDLAELQSLEFNDTLLMPLPAAQKRMTYLRGRIPKPMLEHYDRLCDQGKHGLAILSHQVCTGCHMRVPLATLLDLMAGGRIRLCDNCGRYLLLQEEEPVKAPAPKPRKPRAKAPAKQLAHAL